MGQDEAKANLKKYLKENFQTFFVIYFSWKNLNLKVVPLFIG